MIRFRIAALLLFLASPLLAYRSLTAEPRGVAPGGGLVHLRSNGDVYFSSPSLVTFGDKVGTIVAVVNSLDLLVLAPPRNPGWVTVTVYQGGQQYTTATSFGYGMTEEVLLPIAADEIPGANGTHWSTEIWVHNDADHDVPIDPEYCFFIGALVPCSRPVTRVPAHGTMQLTDRGSTAYPFAHLFPPLQDADFLHYSIVVRELSTGRTAPIAAVRERDLRSGRIVFPAIANDSRHRAALRLYNGSFEITVLIADAATGKVLDVRTIRHYFPTDVSAFAFDNLSDLFATPELRGHERLDVIVEPAPYDRYWALLTLTDNETQQVTAFTP